MAEAKKKSVMKACLLTVGVKQNFRVHGYTGVVETCDKRSGSGEMIGVGEMGGGGG